MKLFNKSNQDIVDYFTGQIKNNKNKKISKIVEEYFDLIIPKEKKEVTQPYMDNMTCFVIQLFERPKYIEIKEEKKENKKELNEGQKMEKFKKKEASNNSMKNLFSFFTNAHVKSGKKEKKMENSSSLKNLFKKK